VLGFAVPEAGDARVTVGDSGKLTNHSLLSPAPLATDAADWTQEPAYEADLRGATRLASHIRTTLAWYASRLGYHSWDGKGAGFRASIRGHRSSKPAPEFNAWGGRGGLLVGDGTSSTGQIASDALDIVAHEFTHSVISATADFTYSGESGALNESLADIFGKSVEGYPSTVVGQTAGEAIRDVLDPAKYDQPATYGQYVSMSSDQDAGGVHTNSGIMNRALTLAILNLNSGSAQPPIADRAVSLSSLVLGSLREVAFAQDSRLEEFAADLTAYCLARQAASSLDPGQQGLCATLEKSFTDTELLGKPL
jgi:hypothetical protein